MKYFIGVEIEKDTVFIKRPSTEKWYKANDLLKRCIWMIQSLETSKLRTQYIAEWLEILKAADFVWWKLSKQLTSQYRLSITRDSDV